MNALRSCADGHAYRSKPYGHSYSARTVDYSTHTPSDQGQWHRRQGEDLGDYLDIQISSTRHPGRKCSRRHQGDVTDTYVGKERKFDIEVGAARCAAASDDFARKPSAPTSAKRKKSSS